MIKSEAKFQTLFSHWVKAEFLTDGGYAFELKHTRGSDSLPFSAVEDHQLNALKAASGKGFFYKISDESKGYKPFDCFTMRGCEAYIVIKYPSFFVLIQIDDFLKEKAKSKRKSLTADRAKQIATGIVNLK